jgi:RNA polymerase sigma-70 factor (ECF subfamily)
MSELTDEEIALAVQGGDAERFGMLLERYEEKLSRYARKFLSDREDTKDIVQEVFIKAYVNIQSFDAAKKFSPWIYRIAHNEFVNALKKRSRMPALFFDPDLIFPHPVAKETADGDAEKGEIRRMLENGLSKIDEKYREVLILYYFEELDYRAISEVLKVPVSTIGVRLKRGRAQLEKEVDPELLSN